MGRLTVQELFRNDPEGSFWARASTCPPGWTRPCSDRGSTLAPQPSPKRSSGTRTCPLASRIPALVVAGTVALRRGDGRADAYLDQARNLAAATGKIARLLPAALARAEAAWTVGDREPAAHELDLLDRSDRAR